MHNFSSVLSWSKIEFYFVPKLTIKSYKNNHDSFELKWYIDPFLRMHPNHDRKKRLLALREFSVSRLTGDYLRTPLNTPTRWCFDNLGFLENPQLVPHDAERGQSPRQLYVRWLLFFRVCQQTIMILHCSVCMSLTRPGFMS